jgi:hypothetical protein
MSAQHHLTHFFRMLIKGLLMALVLTALTQALHHWHPFDLQRLDHFFTTQVVSRLHMGTEAHERQTDQQATRLPLQLQLIELGADLRVLQLEASHPDASSVIRLDGVRPLDRAALARWLRRLADCLAPLGARACKRPASPALAPNVLAIDMDLAPLSGDKPETTGNMVAALNALRQHVHVVVIALDRPDPDSRKQRNDFMKAAQCTRKSESIQGRHGLYFASSRLLQRPQQGPLQYLSAAKGSAAQSADSAWFPGLGTLAHMALQAKVAPLYAQQTLTFYCEQAHTLPAGLEEDNLEAQAGAATSQAIHRLESKYQASYFNWPLLHSDALHFTPVSWPRSKPQDDWIEDSIAQISTQGLKAPVLMLSVESGGSNDKFLTPGSGPQPVSGATLHALQALSVDYPLREASVQGAAVDLLLGALMVLLSCLAHALLLHPMAHYLPRFTQLLAAVLALALVLGIYEVGLRVAAYLMVNSNLWFNPLYVLIGLAIHAYAEGWAGEPAQHAPAPPLRADAWLCALIQVGALLTGIYVLLPGVRH